MGGHQEWHPAIQKFRASHPSKSRDSQLTKAHNLSAEKIWSEVLSVKLSRGKGSSECHTVASDITVQLILHQSDLPYMLL